MNGVWFGAVDHIGAVLKGWTKEEPEIDYNTQEDNTVVKQKTHLGSMEMVKLEFLIRLQQWNRDKIDEKLKELPEKMTTDVKDVSDEGMRMRFVENIT